MQRLAEDRNPAIAAAASKAIYELKKQWEIEEGDSWRFMMNNNFKEVDQQEDNNDTDAEWEALTIFTHLQYRFLYGGLISCRLTN